MPVLIRPVEPAEYDAVADLTVAAYVGDGFIGETWEYVEELRDTAHRAAAADVLVAVAGGRLLGSVTSCPAGSPYRELATQGEGEFRMLAVSAAARGRGVGEALVRACVERSRAAGDRALAISTMADMTTAHRLYERLGFHRSPTDDWWPSPSVQLLAYRLEH